MRVRFCPALCREKASLPFFFFFSFWIAVDVDPAQEARTARKSRVAKNERQRLQNLARAQAQQTEREQRKNDVDRTLASTRISTASMGKFDRKLEGDAKMRGVKRKVREWVTITL